MAIRSPGAFGIRIHFASFDVGEGSVMVYAEGKNGLIVHGPFRGKGPNNSGDFWTASLPGETVFIEVYGTVMPQLEVAEFVHFDKPLGVPEEDEERAALAVLPCHLDVMCYNASQVHPLARDAVGQINFVENGLSFLCSGTLLNDLDDETTVSYFLTAYHCISTQ